MPTPTPTPVPTATPTPSAGVPTWNGINLATDPGGKDSSGVYHPPTLNGQDNMFNPQAGDAPSGGHGPVGNTIDQAQCQVSMSNNYHIHVFIGLYVNGTEYAIPRGLGVADPVFPAAPSINDPTMCFYFTHTHDSTGVVHVEDPNPGGVPINQSLYTVRTIFDVYGMTVNAGQFGPFVGPVRVYTSGQTYRGGTSNGTVQENTLQPWLGDPNDIPLYSHEVIWYLVGPTYPSSLPGVNFFEEF